MSEKDYAARGLEIMRYLKRHGVISINSFGSFDREHLEAIAKIGAGEALKEPLILPSELAWACIRARAKAKRGAKKYKLGSYWFSVLDDNGHVSDKKRGIGSFVFPELSLSLEYNGGWDKWVWGEYNEESVFMLAVDNKIDDLKKIKYTIA